MQQLTEAHSYATYDNAVKKLRDTVGEENMETLCWAILAQPNGRFSPVVMFDNISAYSVTALAQNKIAVLVC